MVRRGQRILEGVGVVVTKIDQVRTPEPTVSDKDSADLCQKVRYLADQLENIYSKLNSQLDVLLSSRAPKDEGETVTIASSADISSGVTAALKNFKRWTLYLKAAGAIDITIELSPDGGTTWFTIPESPVSFSAAGDDVIEFGYDATNIRLTGSNGTQVTAQVRGVY